MTDPTQLRALLLAATPSPWKEVTWWNDSGGFAAVGPHHDDEHERGDNEPNGPNEEAAKRDAALIAALRNNAEALLTIAEAARAIADAGPGHTTGPQWTALWNALSALNESKS